MNKDYPNGNMKGMSLSKNRFIKLLIKAQIEGDRNEKSQVLVAGAQEN
jgi:hypothetical protein